MEGVSPDVVALYRGAPEAFVAGRDALGRELRSQGREDEARAVKALRRPTVVAWALNQLAELDPDGIEGLLDAGAELRAAQRAALSGGDAERLRAATAARRGAVASLTREAVGILSDSGRDPGPHLDDIGPALEAAAVDPRAGEELRRGIIERPSKPGSGFGDLSGLTAVPGGAEERPGRTAEPGAPEPRSEAKIDRTELRVLTRRRDAEVRRAERERAAASELARQVAHAESQLEKLRARHEEAEHRAEAADLDARRAQRDLDGADAPG